MNRRLYRSSFACFFSLSLLVFAACSGGGLSAKRANTNRRGSIDLAAADAVWRPNPKNDIPFVMNADVQRWVGLFQGRFKENFDRWTGRLGAYGPTVSRILKEEGVPQDLIYLAMIESGFNLNATSVAACVGPWQFSRGTGRMYGLNNDFFMDDRRDLVDATRAAARHLNDLYKTYGDWYLAFAAYNAGPGTVNRAVRNTGSNDYWVHAKSRYLRQETKDYVPKVLAALYIVKNYPKYGYTAQSFLSPMQYDRVTVPDATDLAAIAQSSGTSVDVIRELNPALTSGITRPGESTGVFIPKGTKGLFERRYATLPLEERVSGLYHKVGRRESVASIAKTYAVNKATLAKLNKLSPNQSLAPGQVIRIPADHRSLLALANRGASRAGGRGSWAYHRVRRGDTLAAIASRYGTNVRNVASWNRLGSRSRLKIGQRLKIYQAAKAAEYAGAFYAPNFSRSVASRGRVSGVTHIITLDQKEPADLAMTKQEAADVLPKMAALTDDAQLGGFGADQPSVVRTIEDEPPAAGELLQKHTAAILAPRTKPVAVAKTHVVKSGQTLSRIAAIYKTNVGDLRRLNGLKSDTLRINQKLLVSGKAAVVANRVVAPSSRYATMPPKQPGKIGAVVKPVPQTRVASLRRAAPVSSKVIVHQTRSGDTLWMLSKRYGVKITDIKRWNGLNGDSLKPNQKLKIMSGGRSVALVKS